MSKVSILKNGARVIKIAAYNSAAKQPNWQLVIIKYDCFNIH
jgi:hypothetical protein